MAADVDWVAIRFRSTNQTTMQILLFMGESFYPRNHFQDLEGLLPKIPDIQDISTLVRRKMAADVRFDDLSTGQVDWVDVLVLDGNSPPQLLCWDVGHSENSVRLERDGFSLLWKDEKAEWHGIRVSVTIPVAPELLSI
jgi:hypothetical protein